MKKSPQNSEKNDLVRLNVLLQEFGVSSRRKADELIALGAVKVDGKVEQTLGIKVNKKASISVHGKLLKAAPAKATYLFHKPFMMITSRKDEKERSTIFDIPDLKKLPQNVQSVGRLDYRSEGLLVLTNDGELALALSHPKFSVEKTYAVLTSSVFTNEDAEKLKKGIMLDDGPAKAIFVKIGNKEKLGNSTGQWIELVVTEGRNRLVRRMLEALGLSVVRLVRTAIGELRLPNKLEPGKFREVTEIELKYLENIKLEMHKEKNEKTKAKLPKEVIEMRKLKRKVRLNDTEYAQEAERREKRFQQTSIQRKKQQNENKQKEGENKKIWRKDKSENKVTNSKNSYFTKEKNDDNKRSSIKRSNANKGIKK